MSDLSTYLSETGTSQKDFASLVGVDKSIVSRLVRKEIRPGLDLAFTIESVTGGKVPANGWVKEKGAA